MFTPGLFSSLAAKTGVSEAKVRTGMTAATSSLMDGLAGRARDPGAMDELTRLIDATPEVDDPTRAIEEDSPLRKTSSRLLSLSTNDSPGLIKRFASSLGVGGTTAAGMLAAAAGLLLGAFKKYAHQRGGLDAGMLANTLVDERAGLRSALPLNAASTGNVWERERGHERPVVHKRDNRWWWLVAMIPIVLLALWLFNRRATDREGGVPVSLLPTPPAMIETEPTEPITPPTATTEPDTVPPTMEEPDTTAPAPSATAEPDMAQPDTEPSPPGAITPPATDSTSPPSAMTEPDPTDVDSQPLGEAPAPPATDLDPTDDSPTATTEPGTTDPNAVESTPLGEAPAAGSTDLDADSPTATTEPGTESPDTTDESPTATTESGTTDPNATESTPLGEAPAPGTTDLDADSPTATTEPPATTEGTEPDVDEPGDTTGALEEEVQSGDWVTLDAVEFEPGEAEISDAGKQQLQEVAAVLAANPDAKLEIGGFTSAPGSEERNQELSQERAEAAKAALIEQGVDESRLQATGYGEAEMEEETPGEVSANRRIAVKIEAG